MPDLPCNYPHPSSDSGPPKRFYILFDASLSSSNKLHVIEHNLGFIFSRCAHETKITVIRFSQQSTTVLADCAKKDIDCEQLWNTLKVTDATDSNTIALYDNVAQTIENIPSKEYKNNRIVIDVFTTGLDTGSTNYTLEKLVKLIKKKIIGKSTRHFHLYEPAPSELSTILRPQTISFFKNCQIHDLKESPPIGLVTQAPIEEDEIAEEKQGLALLINNHFVTLPDRYTQDEEIKYYKRKFRKGAHIDTALMLEKFEELSGNQVILAENVNSEALFTKLDDFKQKIRAKDPDYIVVIVSTHGSDQRTIVMENDEYIDIYDDLVYQFDNKNFPGFQKPKIFFIQACQTENDTSPPPPNGGHMTQFTQDGACASNFNKPVPNRLHRYQSSKTQFLVAQSTVPNESSYRHHSQGSFYIQAISKCFRKGVKLETLLKEVNAEVNQSLGMLEPGKEQITSIWKLSDFPEDFSFG